MELLQNQGSSQPLVISRDSLEPLEKERGATQGCVFGRAPPPPAAAGLGLGDVWSCSLASGASSLLAATHLPGAEDGDGPAVPPPAVGPPALAAQEQTAPAARVTAVEVPPEPPGCSSGGARLESSFP